jgi:hypothetical protein
MFTYIIIFILQFFYNIAKTFEIRHTTEGKLGLSLINNVIINFLTIISMYLSFKSLCLGDWIVAVAFISGGVFGKYISMICK